MCAPVLGRWVKAFFVVVVAGGATLSLYIVCIYFDFIFIWLLLLLALPESGWHWMNGKVKSIRILCGVYAVRETHLSTRERARINKCGTVVPRYIDIVGIIWNVFSVFIRIHVLKSLRTIIITATRSVDDSLRFFFCWRCLLRLAFAGLVRRCFIVVAPSLLCYRMDCLGFTKICLRCLMSLTSCKHTLWLCHPNKKINIWFSIMTERAWGEIKSSMSWY